MKEKEIESYLVRKVKELGGTAYKFVSPGHDGVPDRLVCLPGGLVWFVELKARGQKPRPLQQVEIGRLCNLDFRVCVIDSIDGVDQLAHDFEMCCVRIGRLTETGGCVG